MQPKFLINAKKYAFFFFLSCFTVSLTPPNNIPKFSSNFMILIISSISSFEMTKVTFTTHFLCTSIANADVMIANGMKTFLAKGTVIHEAVPRLESFS